MTKETQKAEQEKKERQREVALRNLKEKALLNLATAYLVQREESGYGKTDNDAVEEFLYFPAINSGAKAYDFKSGDKFDLIRNSLLGSRQDGKRYSGQISEYNIINTSASIIQDSLKAVKVSDIMKLIGSKVSVDKKYNDKYVSELLESKNDKDKEYATNLIGGYLQYISTRKVSSALSQRAASEKSGLEELVKSKEK